MKKGFTLIELLIVVSIIGILAVALIPSLTDAPARARDVGRKAAVNEVVAAAESYYIDKNEYPPGEFCAVPVGASCVDGVYSGADAAEEFVCEYLNNDPYVGEVTGFGVGGAAPAVAAGAGDVDCESSANSYVEFVNLAADGYEVGILLEATSTPHIQARD